MNRKTAWVTAAVVAAGLTGFAAETQQRQQQQQQPGQVIEIKPGQDVEIRGQAPGSQHQQSEHQQQQQGRQAQGQQHQKQHQASKIIGEQVQDAQGEDLGELTDLIVDLRSGRVSYAVVSYGGALGVGETKVAVPINELRPGKGEKLMLNASKQQLEQASKSATGRWSMVAQEQWAKDVDAFYGQPQQPGREFTRDPQQEMQQQREQQQQQPGQGDATQDRQLEQRIMSIVKQQTQTSPGQQIVATVKQGVVTLNGQVSSEQHKNQMEQQIKQLQGVKQVENKLQVQKRQQ